MNIELWERQVVFTNTYIIHFCIYIFVIFTRNPALESPKVPNPLDYRYSVWILCKNNLRLYRELFQVLHKVGLHDPREKFIRTVDCEGGFREPRAKCDNANSCPFCVARSLQIRKKALSIYFIPQVHKKFTLLKEQITLQLHWTSSI